MRLQRYAVVVLQYFLAITDARGRRRRMHWASAMTLVEMWRLSTTRGRRNFRAWCVMALLPLVMFGYFFREAYRLHDTIEYAFIVLGVVPCAVFLIGAQQSLAIGCLAQLIRDRRCLSCGHSLADTPMGQDRLIICPECAAVWGFAADRPSDATTKPAEKTEACAEKKDEES